MATEEEFRAACKIDPLLKHVQETLNGLYDSVEECLKRYKDAPLYAMTVACDDMQYWDSLYLSYAQDVSKTDHGAEGNQLLGSVIDDMADVYAERKDKVYLKLLDYFNDLRLESTNRMELDQPCMRSELVDI